MQQVHTINELIKPTSHEWTLHSTKMTCPACTSVKLNAMADAGRQEWCCFLHEPTLTDKIDVNIDICLNIVALLTYQSWHNSLSIAFICVVVEPFPFDIECMCSGFTCAPSVARIATSVFWCSGSKSTCLPALLSMSWFNLLRVLMSTFVIIGRIHFSHTLSQCPHICQSDCHTLSLDTCDNLASLHANNSNRCAMVTTTMSF